MSEEKQKQEENKNTKSETESKYLIDNYKDNTRKVRKNIFEDYDVIDSQTLSLPHTTDELVLTLHQKKTDKSNVILKFQFRNTYLFIDAKVSYVFAEMIRILTANVVPDKLKLKSDTLHSGEKNVD